MANKDYRYVINTDLKLTSGSLNQLLNDIKSVDKAIKESLNNSANLKLNIGIDKEKSLSGIQKEVSSIVKGYNGNQAPTIKLKVAIEDAGLNSIQQRINNLKKQLEGISNIVVSPKVRLEENGANKNNQQVEATLGVKSGEFEKLANQLNNEPLVVNVQLKPTPESLEEIKRLSSRAINEDGRGPSAVIRNNANTNQPQINSTNGQQWRGPSTSLGSASNAVNAQVQETKNWQSVYQEINKSIEEQKKVLSKLGESDAVNKQIEDLLKKQSSSKSGYMYVQKEDGSGKERAYFNNLIADKQKDLKDIQEAEKRISQLNKDLEVAKTNLESSINQEPTSGTRKRKQKPYTNEKAFDVAVKQDEKNGQDNKFLVQSVKKQMSQLRTIIKNISDYNPDYKDMKVAYGKNAKSNNNTIGINSYDKLQSEIDRLSSELAGLKKTKKDNDRVDAENSRQAKRDLKNANELTDYNEGKVYWGPNNDYSSKTLNRQLTNPNVNFDDSWKALQQMNAINAKTARESGQSFTKGFQIHYLADDGMGNQVRQIMNLTMAYDHLGKVTNLADKSFSTVAQHMLGNITMHMIVAQGFYAIGDAIKKTTEDMAQFEIEMDKVKFIATDLNTGQVAQNFQSFGKTPEQITSNVTTDTFGIATKYGASAMNSVLPIYQEVLSRDALTKDPTTNKTSPSIAKEMTDKITQFSSIALGPGAPHEETYKMSEDLLSLYQAMYDPYAKLDNNGKPQHVNKMNGFMDYMAQLEQHGVNTVNVTDSVSQIAPELVKKGVDPRQLAGILGAFNLSDVDATGETMTTVGKQFFNSLAHAKTSPDVQEGLRALHIDPNSNMSTSDLMKEVFTKYQEASSGDKSTIDTKLAGTGGKAGMNAPNMGKFLEAGGGEYSKLFLSDKTMNAQGTADKAWEQYAGSLKQDLASIGQEMQKFIRILAEMGALDSLKALTGSFNGLLSTVNNVLDSMNKLGISMSAEGSLNIPKLAMQILSLTLAFKGLRAIANLSQYGTPIGEFLMAKTGKDLGFGNKRTWSPTLDNKTSLLPSTMGTMLPIATQLSGMPLIPTVANTGSATNAVKNTIANEIPYSLPVGVYSDIATKTTKSPYSLPVGPYSNIATGALKTVEPGKTTALGAVGSFFNDALFLSTLKNNGAGSITKGVAQTGKNIGSSITQLFTSLVGPLRNFGLLLTRLTVIGGALALAWWGASKLIEYNKTQQKAQDDRELKNLQDNKGKISNNDVSSWLDLNAKDHKVINGTGPVIQAGKGDVNAMSKVMAQPEGKMSTDDKQRLESLNKQFSDMGITYTSIMKKGGIGGLGYEAQQGISYKVQDKDGSTKTIQFAVNDKKGMDEFQKAIQNGGLTQEARLAQDWSTDTKYLQNYRAELEATTRLTEEMNLSIKDISYNTSKIDFKFMGAENSPVALQQKIGVISQGLGSLKENADTLQQQNNNITNEKDRASADMSAQKNKILNGGVNVDSKMLDDITSQYYLAKEAGDTSTVLNKYQFKSTDREKWMTSTDKGGEGLTADQANQREAQYSALDGFLNLLNQVALFTDAQHKSHDEILQTNQAMQQQQQQLKQSQAQFIIASTGIDVYNAKLSLLQSGTSRAQAILSLADSPYDKIPLTANVMRNMSNQLGTYRGELGSVQSSMASLRNKNPNQDFSLNALYNPGENGLTSQQMAYKQMLDTTNQINQNIDATTTSLKQQRDAMQELILTTDKYNSMWTRVQDRIKLVRDMDIQLTSNKVDSSLVTSNAELRRSMTGDPNQNDWTKQQFEQNRDKNMEVYTKLNTALQTYGSDSDQLKKALSEVDQTLGTSFNDSIIQPLKGIIDNDVNGQNNLFGNNVTRFQDATSNFVNGLNNDVQQFGNNVNAMGQAVSNMQTVISNVGSPTGGNVGAGGVNIGGVSDGNVQQLADVIRNNTTGTVSDNAMLYVQAGMKYGIDPRFLAAVSQHETGGNSSAIRDRNNPSGIMDQGGSHIQVFDSLMSGIDDEARILKNFYLDEGKTTIPQIQLKWAPVGAENDPGNLNSDWRLGVANFYSKMTGISQNDLLGGTGVQNVPKANLAPVNANSGSNGVSNQNWLQQQNDAMQQRATEQMHTALLQGLQDEYNSLKYTNISDGYYRSGDLAYKDSYSTEPLGVSGHINHADLVAKTKQQVADDLYDTNIKIGRFSYDRGVAQQNADNAKNSGNQNEYNWQMQIVSKYDSLINQLQQNTQSLNDFNNKLSNDFHEDPRYQQYAGRDLIRSGYQSLRDNSNQLGNDTYMRIIEEINTMNQTYMTHERKTQMMQDMWNKSGVDTYGFSVIKREGAQADINLMYDKMAGIKDLLKQFAQGTQDWYTTLEDALTVQKQLKQLEDQRLQNTQEYFDLTGKGMDAYVAQKASNQSKDYAQSVSNLYQANQMYGIGAVGIEDGVTDTSNLKYGVRTASYTNKPVKPTDNVNFSNSNIGMSQSVADYLKIKYGINGTLKTDSTGGTYLETGATFTKDQMNNLLYELNTTHLASSSETYNTYKKGLKTQVFSGGQFSAQAQEAKKYLDAFGATDAKWVQKPAGSGHWADNTYTKWINDAGGYWDTGATLTDAQQFKINKGLQMSETSINNTSYDGLNNYGIKTGSISGGETSQRAKDIKSLLDKYGINSSWVGDKNSGYYDTGSVLTSDQSYNIASDLVRLGDVNNTQYDNNKYGLYTSSYKGGKNSALAQATKDYIKNNYNIDAQWVDEASGGHWDTGSTLSQTQAKQLTLDLQTKSLSEGGFQYNSNLYGLRTQSFSDGKDSGKAQQVAKYIKDKYGVNANWIGDDNGGHWQTDTTMVYQDAQNLDNELKKQGMSSTNQLTQQTDMNQQLASLQIISGLYDKMNQQMTDYKNAVTGAFKAGALSVSEYLKKLESLRNVSAEARESAISMVTNMQSGFQNALSNALSSGMQGNINVGQEFINNMKQNMASTISGQLSTTLLQNTGLQDVMNSMISSITTASTSGNPQDIINMFNKNNYGDKIKNTLDPFVPMIEQITASTNGIFNIMKNQTFNAPSGFKVDQYINAVAKGMDYQGIKRWYGGDISRNDVGSPNGPINGSTDTSASSSNNSTVSMNKIISIIPKELDPTGLPQNQSATANSEPNYTGQYDYTQQAGTVAQNTSNTQTQPEQNLMSLINNDTLSILPIQNIIDNNKRHTKTNIDFRNTPAYGDNVMSVIPSGAELDYYGIDQGWAKVGYKGKTGYVGQSYIYHTGGIAGVMNFANANNLKTDEVSAILQRSEVTLQPKQIQSLVGGLGGSNNTTSGGDINITIKIDGGSNYDQKGIENVVETAVQRAMKEMGRQQRLNNLTLRGTSY